MGIPTDTMTPYTLLGLTLRHCLPRFARESSWKQTLRHPGWLGLLGHAACSSPLVVHMYSTNTVQRCDAIFHDCTPSALLLKYELYFSAPSAPVLRHPTPTVPPQKFCATPIGPAPNCSFDKESIRSCYLASIIAKGSWSLRPALSSSAAPDLVPKMVAHPNLVKDGSFYKNTPSTLLFLRPSSPPSHPSLASHVYPTLLSSIKLSSHSREVVSIVQPLLS